jgi:oxygen-independent coproporphyrinogen-3 oxidase
MGADGLLTIDGNRVLIREQARPLVRTVCAAFDRYLQRDEARHSAAL